MSLYFLRRVAPLLSGFGAGRRCLCFWGASAKEPPRRCRPATSFLLCHHLPTSLFSEAPPGSTTTRATCCRLLWGCNSRLGSWPKPSAASRCTSPTESNRAAPGAAPKAVSFSKPLPYLAQPVQPSIRMVLEVAAAGLAQPSRSLSLMAEQPVAAHADRS